MSEQLVAAGLTEPKYHAWGKPMIAEREAVHRIIALAEALDVPIQIFHVSGAEFAEEIARAQARGLKVWAETCPHYLTLTAGDLDRPGFEGAKFVFGPPARTAADQDALWGYIRRGVIEVVSSDHSPTRFDDPKGKKAAGENAPFNKIPNGIPGLAARLPVLFTEGVSKGRIDAPTFVRLVSTNPAKLFGLHPQKGALSPGSDADIIVWDPQQVGDAYQRPHASRRRLYTLRGLSHDRLSSERVRARRAGIRRGKGHRSAGTRPVSRSIALSNDQAERPLPNPLQSGRSQGCLTSVPASMRARQPYRSAAKVNLQESGTWQTKSSLSRRHFVAGSAAVGITGFPNVLRAQTKEIFIGGPATPGLTDGLFPLIEKKHNVKVLFEGTNSLINLEKLRSNKARPTMTLTMMDDPVLILAERDKLIKKLPADVTNLAGCRRHCQAARRHVGQLVPADVQLLLQQQGPAEGLVVLRRCLGPEVQGAHHRHLDAHHASDRSAARGHAFRDQEAARPVHARLGTGHRAHEGSCGPTSSRFRQTIRRRSSSTRPANAICS